MVSEMPTSDSAPVRAAPPEGVLRDAYDFAMTQLGGTLATMHAEDGTPYVTFVFFHLTEDGHVVFGSQPGSQHARNLAATPEVSFLIDNREVIREDWRRFTRIVIEGRAERVPAQDPRYEELMRGFREKNRAAAELASQYALYRIVPRRLVLMRGIGGERRAVEFDE